VEKTVTSARRPATLMQAHEELVHIRPSRDASLPAWLAYYQHSVTVYEHIAEVDPSHGAEAHYWAQREQAHAKQLAAQIRATKPHE
jgi:hypothetical protein